MDTISRVLHHITLLLLSVFISTTYEKYTIKVCLLCLLSKTMSTTDIVMTISVPAADTGTTITTIASCCFLNHRSITIFNIAILKDCDAAVEKTHFLGNHCCLKCGLLQFCTVDFPNSHLCTTCIRDCSLS